jgi:hypothetical protein
MRLFVAFATMVFAVSALPIRAETFTGSSLNVNFTIVGKLNGTYSWENGTLTVKIDEGFLRLKNPKKHGDKVSAPVRSISAILVKHPKDDETRFITLERSERARLDAFIEGANPLPLPPLEFKIPTGSRTRADLMKTWIAFSVTGVFKSSSGGNWTGVSYIHMPVYLFTDASTNFPFAR